MWTSGRGMVLVDVNRDTRHIQCETGITFDVRPWTGQRIASSTRHPPPGTGWQHMTDPIIPCAVVQGVSVEINHKRQSPRCAGTQRTRNASSVMQVSVPSAADGWGRSESQRGVLNSPRLSPSRINLHLLYELQAGCAMRCTCRDACTMWSKEAWIPPLPTTPNDDFIKSTRSGTYRGTDDKY